MEIWEIVAFQTSDINKSNHLGAPIHQAVRSLTAKFR